MQTIADIRILRSWIAFLCYTHAVGVGDYFVFSDLLHSRTCTFILLHSDVSLVPDYDVCQC